MLIQCEKCQTRYNLDEAKIPGKGAKVTCPTCKNVFVVMKDGSHPKPEGAAPVAPPPGQSSAPKSLLDSFFDDGKTVAGMFPGPGRGPASGAPVGSVPMGAPPAPARGLRSWKVRVASGLVYDFTDPSTLKSWIAEKKVTPADAISEDGASWTVIASLPNVDAFFGGVSVPAATGFGAPGIPPVTGFGAQPAEGAVPPPFIPPPPPAGGPSLGDLFGSAPPAAPPGAADPFNAPPGGAPFASAPPGGANPFGNPFGGGAPANPFGDPFTSAAASAPPPSNSASPFANLPPPPPPAKSANPFAPPPPSPFPAGDPFGSGGGSMQPGGAPFAGSAGGPPSIAPPPFGAMGNTPRPAPPPWASGPAAASPPAPPMFGGSAVAPPPPPAPESFEEEAAPPGFAEPRGERRIGRMVGIGVSAVAVAALAGAIFLQKDVIWTALRPPPLPTATATPPPAVATLAGEARVRYLTGRRYLRLDDAAAYEKAAESFRAALAGAPANPRAAAGVLESLALRRAAGGAVEEADLNVALGAASSALKEDSRGVETNRALAQYYAAVGKPEQAVGYLETALASRPDDAESLFLRSTLRAADPAGAQEDLALAAREPDLTRAHRAMVAALPAGSAQRVSAEAALAAIEKANAKVREALDANAYAFDPTEVERLMPGEPVATPVVVATVEVPVASPVVAAATATETAVAIASAAPATATPTPAPTPAIVATVVATVAATPTPAPAMTAVARTTPTVAPTAVPRQTQVAVSTPVRATPTPVVARTVAPATPAPTATPSDSQIATAGAEDFYLAGTAYLQAGALPDAIEQFRAAVQASPRNTKYQIALGAALLRSGQKQAAADVLTRVRDVEPNNAEAHKLLGILFESTGQNAEACAEFGDYLRLAPSARDATDVRARLVRNGC